VKATRVLPYIALVLVGCGGDPGAAGSATFEAAGRPESIVNPSASTQQLDIQIEGDRAGTDAAHAVVFFVDVPPTPGAFDCTSFAPSVTYYEASGSVPGDPSFVAPTWVATNLQAGSSCSGEWQQQGARMVGSFTATLTQLLVASPQTLDVSGSFDVPMP
jgi:hypothetical protein